jgi:membrane-bound metal-dependent hydrolase YbcI (DUF457 family)
MPVTPFHLGIGLLCKGASPARVSFLAFATSQAAIDLETAFYLVTEQWPLHRELHTFALALLAGLAAAVLVWAVGRVVPYLASRWRAEFDLMPALIGGAFGGLTHPLLDGMMHRDIKPFAPFTDDNPLLFVIGVVPLHILCVIAAAAGGLLWAARAGRLTFRRE